jgi:hypothetical protein
MPTGMNTSTARGMTGVDGLSAQLRKKFVHHAALLTGAMPKVTLAAARRAWFLGNVAIHLADEHAADPCVRPTSPAS